MQSGVYNGMRVTDLMKNGQIYNGVTQKFGITIDGENYIVKLNKQNDLSVFCEYICSRFMASLGIRTHEVVIGYYNGRPVDVIKDFTSQDTTLHVFGEISQSSLDTDIQNKSYSYIDVIDMINKYNKMSEIDRRQVLRDFWWMSMVDAVVGNRDRHRGNWGFISKNGRYRLCPLYDNGAGLFPGVQKVINQFEDSEKRKEFIYDRVYIVPASLFEVERSDRNYRSNFYEICQRRDIDPIFNMEIDLFKNLFSWQNIFDIISEIVQPIQIDEIFKSFYKFIVTARFRCIILNENFDLVYGELNKRVFNET